jgi:hypothetical protein
MTTQNVLDYLAGDFRDRHTIAQECDDISYDIALAVMTLAEDPAPMERSADPLTPAQRGGGADWAPVHDVKRPVVVAKIHANRADLAIAAACAPDPGAEVARTITGLATGLGITRGRALAYCDVGAMLGRLPSTAERLLCGAFDFSLLRIIADVTATVGTDHLPAVDAELAVALTPVRARQVVPGPRTLRRTVTEIVARHAPGALPPDPDDDLTVPAPDQQTDFSVDTRAEDVAGTSTLHVTLPADEATAVVRIIDAVAVAHGVSRARAFADLLHGEAGDVSVTLNCYRNLDCGTMHFENRWLSAVATERWMARVTDLAVPGHSETSGRFATDNQRALHTGVHGTCRAPGCERPAAECQADHIRPYDDDPRTTSWGMQPLCPQCHNLKTRGLHDYDVFPDGTTHITSRDDGHIVVTVPTGPMKDAILTFATRLQRRTAAREEHNAARETYRETTRAAAAAARPGADSEVPF